MTPILYQLPHYWVLLLQQIEPEPGRFSYHELLFNLKSQARAEIVGLPKPYWSTLSNTPAVLALPGKQDDIVFSGVRSSAAKDPYHYGCLVAAAQTAGSSNVVQAPTSTLLSAWALQPWSLSSRCNIFQSDAVLDGDGQAAAAWQGDWNGGHGFLYRLGPSQTIPASGADMEVPLPQTAEVSKMAVAADDAGNSDIWLYWGQLGSPPSTADGLYAKNLSSNGPVLKAPGSVRGSADLDIFARPAFAATNTHPGVFAAYDVPPPSSQYLNCSNGQKCTIRLWRVGSPTAIAIPGTTGVVADNVALAPGPRGRLWIAWVDATHRTFNVLRTNEADDKFSAVKTYPVGICPGYGLIGLAGGPYQRLAVGLQCPKPLWATNSPPLFDYYTQILPSLTVALSSTVANTTAFALHVRVTDVGDPVPGATVTLGSLTATTGASGFATITVPKGEAPGNYTVTVTVPDYAVATSTLKVTA